MRARAAASRATNLLESVVLTTYSNIDETDDLLQHPSARPQLASHWYGKGTPGRPSIISRNGQTFIFFGFSLSNPREIKQIQCHLGCFIKGLPPIILMELHYFPTSWQGENTSTALVHVPMDLTLSIISSKKMVCAPLFL